MLRDFPLAETVRPALVGAVTDGPSRTDQPVRDAATVMLVRPAPGGVEVFTIRRVPRMAFAAGMVVFPGGAVEPRDADPLVPWYGPTPAVLARALDTTEQLARALVVAAVRETFEECGVLLAGPVGAPPLGRPLADAADWELRRQALIDGGVTLADVLAGTGLQLRADLLRPWAHWITPPGEPRRFDTRFFVAALPLGQQPRYLAGEAAQAGWRSPTAAVTGHGQGQLPMLPPTLVAMEELAAARSVQELLTTPRRLRPVSPWLVRTGDGDDAGYALRVDLDGLGGGDPAPSAGDPSPRTEPSPRPGEPAPSAGDPS